MQLKRRFDLIPNLVEIVKGYANHERNTFEEVTSARTKYLSSNTPEDMMKANGELTQVLGKLFAVAEAYPELKANTNFLELQENCQKQRIKLVMQDNFITMWLWITIILYKCFLQALLQAYLVSKKNLSSMWMRQKSDPQIKF